MDDDKTVIFKHIAINFLLNNAIFEIVYIAYFYGDTNVKSSPCDHILYNGNSEANLSVLSLWKIYIEVQDKTPK